MKSTMLRKLVMTCALVFCTGCIFAIDAHRVHILPATDNDPLDSVQVETIKKMVQLVATLLKKEESAVLLKKKGAKAKAQPKGNNGVSDRAKKLTTHKKDLDKPKSHWDSLHHVKSANYVTASDSVNKVVFGFHPYWMGSAYKSYNFSLLSDLAYFSLSLDPNNGFLSGPRQWREEALQDSVTSHGGRFHLTINCFSNGVNGGFLELQTRRTATIRELMRRVEEDTLIHGLVLDFEFFPPTARDYLSLFVDELYDELNPKGKTLSVTLPAVDLKGVYDIGKLSKSVDYFLLMGYDYFGSWSTDAGPVAPLNSQPIWGSYSVEASLDNYFHRGVAPAQMVLVVPYYGSSFEVAEPRLPSANRQYLKHMTYSQVRDRFGEKAIFESVSQSVFLNEPRNELYEQIWFDNARSLAAKYDLAIQEGLAGVGIWALGYDNGYTELWQLLDQKFGSVPPEGAQVGTAKEPLNMESLVQLVTDPSVLGPLVGLIGLIVMAAFLLSLRQKAIRDLVFQSVVMRWLLLLLGPLLCVYIILDTPYTTEGVIALIGVIGGYCVYFLLDAVPYEFKRKIP